jgi:hypothetical protein
MSSKVYHQELGVQASILPHLNLFKKIWLETLYKWYIGAISLTKVKHESE